MAKDGPLDGRSHVSTRIMGTYGYAAPEYMATGIHKFSINSQTTLDRLPLSLSSFKFNGDTNTVMFLFSSDLRFDFLVQAI